MHAGTLRVLQKKRYRLSCKHQKHTTTAFREEKKTCKVRLARLLIMRYKISYILHLLICVICQKIRDSDLWGEDQIFVVVSKFQRRHLTFVNDVPYCFLKSHIFLWDVGFNH
ncbi:hypothetical protein THIOM_000086 [Candidatus Thiomargarita nelsonii]|uniref:Uncharacterized protein n=1 Tax=Candidatus Thiomargarita nelsonii TaxID=1003181 RepID=A0A176S824_9GAMM|nr:hypothetical protein THIOM_000086 [Candidatus Thiomargarita nelsonii]